MLIQLPADAVAVGYKEVRPYQHEQVFQSERAGFTGTEREFVAAGHGYAYVQVGSHVRHCVQSNLIGEQAVSRDLAVLGTITHQFQEDGKWFAVIDDDVEMPLAGVDHCLDVMGTWRQENPALAASFVRFNQ